MIGHKISGSIAIALATLLIAAILSNPASAEPVWCGGEDTLDSHPLNHRTLRRKVNEAGADRDLAAAIDLIRQQFERRQGQAPTGDAQAHQDYLEAYRGLLQANDGPADFHFTHQELQNRAFLAKTGDELVLMDCSKSPAEQNSDSVTLTNVALAAYAIDRIGGEIVAQNLDVVVASIDQVSTSYRNWLMDDGLRQWPWELAVNGWIHRSDPFNADAPRSQLVFMRPSAGLEFQWASQSDAQVDASVAIEPIGMVWYLGEPNAYDKWWGVSALVTLGTNDQGAGVGGLLRYKNYHLGVTDRSNENDLFFYIGFDLHTYIKSDDGLKSDLENWLKTRNVTNNPPK